MDNNTNVEGAQPDVTAELQRMQEAQDFTGALRLILDHKEFFTNNLQTAGIREILKKATKDRLLLSFVDSVGFGVRKAEDSLARLEKLMKLQPGTLVLNSSWGLGKVVKLDYFYRRITVDFRNRKGHQLTFDAACETVSIAPENHILVTAAADPDRIRKMLEEEPGEFVKAMLKSFGDMPITRLEELSAQNGFVKLANWKSFWEKARADLRKDKLVEIPTRRAEPLHLKATAETYGDEWFNTFAALKDPKSILSSVLELQGTGRAKMMSDSAREKLSNRLAFALKGARGVDDALYARLAFAVDSLKLAPPDTDKLRAYLWENDRYIDAARNLPARDTGTLVVFLTAQDRETTKKHLFAALPRMCFPLLSETLNFFKDDADCEEAVAALLKQPDAPATLVTYVLGRYGDFEKWSKLPALIVILEHAIALGEGRQSGETLKMQNVIRRLFANQEWLEDIFKKLNEADKALFFERFQASIAWDPSTHHLIVVRMARIAPELASRQVKKAETKEEVRITSVRSYAERKAAYERLVTVEIPENTKAIEFARGYGDLSENFEYQSAKEKERMLLQKQATMQAELDAVKPTDFADVVADSVKPGVSVVISTASGEEKTYVILGEWDNNLDRNIISCKTRLADNMLGKAAGDTFDLPDAEGGSSVATISAVLPLSDEMKNWVKGV